MDKLIASYIVSTQTSCTYEIPKLPFRRKFKLVCKTQSSGYNAEQEERLPRNLTCKNTNISLPKSVSDLKVDHFVKSLDIGHVFRIAKYPGDSRTVTGLVFMILDLHLRLPHLQKELIWFNLNFWHSFLLGPIPSGDYIFLVVHSYTRFFDKEFTMSITTEKIVSLMSKMFMAFLDP